MDKSFIDLFEEQVLKTPGNIAVVFEQQQVSYYQLNEQANNLANYLRSKGITDDSLVPLYIERGINMIAGMLGIMKAGAAYVPIDTDFPQERITYMLKDTSAKVVVSSSISAGRLAGIDAIDIVEIESVPALSKSNLPTKVLPAQLAYVIYTSGSTGAPKGVMVEHRNLVDYISGLIDKTNISTCRSFALVSTIATDLGNTVIYGSLATGGTLHLFTKEAVSNTLLLHRYFTTHMIDCLKIVPSHWQVLGLDDHLLLPLKLLIFGGEALPEKIVTAIQATGTQCKIINHYGPTETTIGKLLHIIEPGAKYEYTVPIGRPFSNTKVLVLTKNLKLCPVGVPGQLYITGDGVARGYLNNPALTEEKFIPNPYSKEHYAVMYSTGDLVKYLADGNISFIGRADNQVKIRGYRIELGEIESVLQQCKYVSQAVVLAREDKQGNKRLAGYIVPSGTYDREEILGYLKDKLPDYMIPSVMMELESLPLTANGKIDRNALPDPDAGELLADQYVSPRNDIEARLSEIWQEILEVEKVGMNDDFFELGGHSLLAVRLVSAIRKAFEAEMPISDIFDYPTVALLASQLSGNTGNALLAAIKVQLPRPQYIPLSFSQERLWFIDRLEGSTQYHLPAVLRLKGVLNKTALEKSLQQVVNRHEVLRTVFVEKDGMVAQQIKEKNAWALTFTDGTAFEDKPALLEQHLQQLVYEPFNLSEDYLLRASLVALNEADHVLVVTLHHIASDGWSTAILVKEVVGLYRYYDEGIDAGLVQLPVQYADYAIWQRDYLKGDVLNKKIAYWKEKLNGVAPLQLPTDFKRPPLQTTKGSITSFWIDKELSAQLQQFSQHQGATIFMTLLAAFNLLLHRYSGQEDICVGTPVGGRQQQELEGMIGFFVNMLALRTEVNGSDSFKSLLQKVKMTTMEAYAQQDLPFEKVVESVARQRDMSRSPLFQVMFIMRNTPELPELKLGKVVLSRHEHEHTTSQFEITLVITETSNGLHGSLEYNTALFSRESINRLIVHFNQLLAGIIDAPQLPVGALQILTSTEQQQILVDFNATREVYPNNKTIVGLFEDQVKKSPEEVAVIFENKQLTYRELHERSTQLAHYIAGKGIGKESMVPICIERGWEMIVGLLAIMKAGAAYVPIDPKYPEDRITYMLQDIGAAIIISSRESKSRITGIDKLDIIEIDAIWPQIDKYATVDLQLATDPTQLAYVIYTSGSTGKPKGVMIEHTSVVNLLTGVAKEVGFNACSIFMSVTTFSFDICYLELYMPLIAGGTLVVLPSEVTMDGFKLAGSIQRFKPTHMQGTPSTWQLLMDAGWENKEAIKMLVGGEALKEDLKTAMTKKGDVWNVYGPTETTIWSTIHKLTTNEPVLIGVPLANTTIQIVNSEGQLAPVGVAGEILIGGVGLARGYFKLPELTLQKFIADKFNNDPNAKMYRTGDLGRWFPGGKIECLGRIDEQVKIRGYRIELGEIETLLHQTGMMHQSVVLAREDKLGNKRLIGYIVPAASFEKEAMLAQLRNKLPEYMIPALWMEMEILPLTPNGKINKKALPDPDASELVGNEYVAPRNELETKLSAIWKELLHVERVGINDNFFELGGHSLLTMRMVSAIEQQLLVSISINILFQFTTISELSKYLEIELNTEWQEDDDIILEQITI
ncbi:MAG: amino acid adenylation domain-containing protein [Ferruginibacter sp.]